MADVVQLDTKEIADAISRIARQGERMPQEVLPHAAEVLHAAVLEVFETEGFGSWERFWWERDGLPKPPGRRWQGTPKLLQDTGNLVGSMTPEHGVDYAEVFTNVPYGKYHASQRPREVIPLRDFFDVDEAELVEEIEYMIQLHMSRPSLAAE